MWFILLAAISTRNYGDDVILTILPSRKFTLTMNDLPVVDLLVYISIVVLLPVVISCLYGEYFIFYFD